MYQKVLYVKVFGKLQRSVYINILKTYKIYIETQFIERSNHHI